MGIIMSTFTVFQSDKTVSVLEESLQAAKEEHKLYVESTTKTISSLQKENRKLKSKVSTYKIIKPDGTIEERTMTESESEETITTQIKEEYEKRLLEQIEKRETELSRKIETIIKENKKLTITAGSTTGLNYYGAISYKVYAPFVIETAAFRDGSFSFGIGFQL